mmetsp:Transcript_22474/g.62331  ORF Transcript_22474/g.62331 Transcript_22474/m.62331 type:complete len:545 (+) Transcript_22474:187-1821(+)
MGLWAAVHPAGQTGPSAVQGCPTSARSRRGQLAAPLRAQPLQADIMSLASARMIQGLKDVAGAVTIAGSATRQLQRSRPGMENFPPGPVGDTVFQLLADPVGCIERLSRVYGGAVGLQLGGERCVLLSDPALIAKVVVEDAAKFVKEGTAFFPGSSLAGNGLLVSDGDTWKRQRQLSNPAFRRSAVKSYARAMQAATERMASTKWGGEPGKAKILEVFPEFNVLTLEIIADAVFGSAIEEEEAMEVMTGIVTAFEYFGRRAATGFIIPEWLPTPENDNYNAAVQSLDKTVLRIIADRRAELSEGNDPAAKGLIDQLLLTRDDSGEGMSDKELRDEIMTLMVAGQETSAILLTWACALLAWHPQAQAKVRAELDSALRGAPADSASELPYLEAVLLETMRVLPPAYMIGRCAKEDVELGGWAIPKGTSMLVGCVVMHRDPRWWGEDAHLFVPERWMARSGQLADGSWVKALSGMGSNGAYLPFGGGPRNCIGTGFAMMEAKLVMASVLQKFQIDPPSISSQFPKPEAIITLRPPSDLKLSLTPIH